MDRAQVRVKHDTERQSQEYRPGLPFSVVLGLLAGLAVYTIGSTELRDVDLYWHLLAGEELASGQAPGSLGLTWTFAPSPLGWTSTQWLAELVLHGLHTVGGWTAVAGLRVVTAGVAIALVARATLRGRPKALAGMPFVVAVTAIAFVSQERPQQATLIGAAVLGGILVDGIVGAQLPRWYLVLPATALWANVHGGWILVPAVLGLIAIGRWLDSGPRDPVAMRALGLCLLAAASGALTPAGLHGVAAVFRFSQASGLIREWAPTQPTFSLGTLTVAMLILVATSWARSGPVPRSEVLAVLVLLIFSWTAWRNVAPALVVLAPVTAHRLVTAYPTVGRREPAWSVPVGIALAMSLSVAGLLGLPAQTHLPKSEQPIRLAEQISELDPGQRVLNSYNVAGLVLYFGGPNTRVAIDGRFDRYRDAYVKDYLGLTDLAEGSQDLLERLDPTAALIEDETALAQLLIQVRGWRVIGRENGFVLLVPAGPQAD